MAGYYAWIRRKRADAERRFYGQRNRVFEYKEAHWKPPRPCQCWHCRHKTEHNPEVNSKGE